MVKSPWLLALCAVGVGLSACSCGSSNSRKALEGTGSTESEPERLVARIVHTYPHATDAYTQGLVFHQGRLYESTGREGHSSLRELTLGAAQPAWKESLAADLFAEGLASDGERLYQLTWTDQVLFTWTGLPPRQEATTHYEGDGWGLCFRQGKLVRSDGTATLFFHDVAGFARTGSVPVTLRGEPLDQLNELECAEDAVYANVWHTSYVVRIDPATGKVTAVIDASDLVRAVAAQLKDREAVLNGVAFEPGTGRIFMTGKLWPSLFEVRLESTAAKAKP